MCYPKPGPRCSSSAALALSKATHVLDTTKRGTDAWFTAREAQQQAKMEFDITPAGLKMLEDRAKMYHLGGDDYTGNADLDRARAIRTERLKAVKHLKAKAHQKPEPATEVPSTPVQFLPASEPRRNRPAEEVHAELVAAAEPWSMQLSDDELHSIRWMTDMGSVEANTHIAGINTYQDVVSKEQIIERMELVDAALSRFDSPSPHIVYRGVRAVSVPGGRGRDYWLGEDKKQELFLEDYQVGAVVESEFYMPTSSDPSTADEFADFGVVLEMKTKKGAPVSEVSSRPKESEWLLPRKAKFRVVGVHRNVTVGRGERTVVQLEDVDD